MTCEHSDSSQQIDFYISFEQEYIQCPREYASRYTISHLVHSLILVLRASNCLHSCAQWYCSELQKLTKTSGKLRETFSIPGKKLKRLPQGMISLANSNPLLSTENGKGSPQLHVHLMGRLTLMCMNLIYRPFTNHCVHRGAGFVLTTCPLCNHIVGCVIVLYTTVTVDNSIGMLKHYHHPLIKSRPHPSRGEVVYSNH